VQGSHPAAQPASLCQKSFGPGHANITALAPLLKVTSGASVQPLTQPATASQVPAQHVVPHVLGQPHAPPLQTLLPTHEGAQEPPQPSVPHVRPPHDGVQAGDAASRPAVPASETGQHSPWTQTSLCRHVPSASQR
jgi:hypothetical protein